MFILNTGLDRVVLCGDAKVSAPLAADRARTAFTEQLRTAASPMCKGRSAHDETGQRT
jgi:hypothetical protein